MARPRISASSCSTTWSTSRFKKAGAAATNDVAKQEIAKQKAAVSEAKAGEFLDTCMKKTSKSRVECALAASDLDTGVAKCDENK